MRIICQLIKMWDPKLANFTKKCLQGRKCHNFPIFAIYFYETSHIYEIQHDIDKHKKTSLKSPHYATKKLSQINIRYLKLVLNHALQHITEYANTKMMLSQGMINSNLT